MASRREQLNQELKDILDGNGVVYFQPDERSKLEYPCIVYSKARPFSGFADNKRYRSLEQWSVVLMSKSAINPAYGDILALPYCSSAGSYREDGIYHDAFDLYY